MGNCRCEYGHDGKIISKCFFCKPNQLKGRGKDRYQNGVKHMELEIINKLYLELSQVTTAKTRKEINLESELGKAVKMLREGKRKFAPHTTNSDVDDFLEKHKDLI